MGAVPENSPVGESASNGRAERSVQRFEDQLRTLLAELEHRLGTQLKPDSPALAWLVAYVTVLLNKYHVNDDTNLTAYEYLHGKPADEEKLAFSVRGCYLASQSAEDPTWTCAGPWGVSPGP